MASVIAVPELTYGAQWINFEHISHRRSLSGGHWLCTSSPGYTILFGLRASSAAMQSDADMLDGRFSYALPFLTAGLLVTLEVSLITVVLSHCARQDC